MKRVYKMIYVRKSIKTKIYRDLIICESTDISPEYKEPETIFLVKAIYTYGIVNFSKYEHSGFFWENIISGIINYRMKFY